jgi:hypothetical protein
MLRQIVTRERCRRSSGVTYPPAEDFIQRNTGIQTSAQMTRCLLVQ